MAPASPSRKRILVLDPDRRTQAKVCAWLRRAGYAVTTAASPAEAAALLDRQSHDALVVSLGRKLEGIGSLRELASSTPILLVSRPDRVRDAVRGLRQGTGDYLLDPPDPVELETRLERLLERCELDSRIALLQEQLSRADGARQIEVRSPAMRRVLDRVQRVAPLRSTVLIRGESGVGKELVARLIHLNSPRCGHPFLALNCAAIPADLIESELFGHERGAFTGAHARTRGKFEIADRGTLFLDEIGDMDAATQAKLLRVLEQKEFMRVGGDHSIRVDVRLIAATNADLERLVGESAFRRDLYYRLKVVTIDVPPLRERGPDIPALVETFLEELSRANAVPRKSVSPAAMEALTSYHWPGNVRELKNLIESLLVSAAGREIQLEDLPPTMHRAPAGTRTGGLWPGTTLRELERELIRVTLEHTGGNRTHSARLLGIGVRTLQRKIRSYDLRIAPRRRRPRAGQAAPPT
jgi:DNA-binding NtrC family response regulator